MTKNSPSILRQGLSAIIACLFLYRTTGFAYNVGLSKYNTKRSIYMTPSSDVDASKVSAVSRRSFTSKVSAAVIAYFPYAVNAEDGSSSIGDVQVKPTGDVKKIFNEGRALESQGNVASAQRFYQKVTKISPKFIYGWSNLGNTQVALGQLPEADRSYTNAIDLCRENIQTTQELFGVPRCNDEYLLLLNRGALRLNNNMPKEALADLQKANGLRGKPDAIILQNVARAKEINGMYGQADRDYTLAISMTSNEVNPFWLRSAMVKLQIGELKEGYDLLRRVENRFPEAPEVRAAYATFLAAQGNQIAAQQKYLEIPDRQRQNYVDQKYLKQVIAWPPAMIDGLSTVTSAVEKAADTPVENIQ
mmetsp:Transcript_8082/g.11583  ORF Transcript_8082/g.11583 Transcript_8082/m.11583 type:complete len:362 (+) Transcript_8082:162-1247(+)